MVASLKNNVDGLLGRIFFGGLGGFGVRVGLVGVILGIILGVGVGFGLLKGYLLGNWLLSYFYI
jgi:hypothetical protein